MQTEGINRILKTKSMKFSGKSEISCFFSWVWFCGICQFQKIIYAGIKEQSKLPEYRNGDIDFSPLIIGIGGLCDMEKDCHILLGQVSVLS